MSPPDGHAKGIDHLESLGMLAEITDRPRGRIFVYDGILGLLNERIERP